MNKKRRKSLSQQDTELDFGTLMVRCSVFTLIFCGLTVLLSVVTSLFFYNTNDPTSKISFAGLLSLFLSCFICSFVLSKINGQKFLLSGFVLGLMIMIITLAISLFIKEGKGDSLHILLRGLLPVVSIFGSFLGRKRESKRPKHKIRM